MEGMLNQLLLRILHIQLLDLQPQLLDIDHGVHIIEHEIKKNKILKIM